MRRRRRGERSLADSTTAVVDDVERAVAVTVPRANNACYWVVVTDERRTVHYSDPRRYTGEVNKKLPKHVSRANNPPVVIISKVLCCTLRRAKQEPLQATLLPLGSTSSTSGAVDCLTAAPKLDPDL